MIGSRQVPSYVDQPGVDPSRHTETYASLTVDVDNPRWAGVPFTLRSGKALKADSAEIAIHFRPLPQYLLAQWPGVEPNALRIGLREPYVRLTTTLNGPERTAERRQLEACSTAPRFTAYAHLIEEMLKGDPMLFITSDEAEEAWRIIDPVMNAWSARGGPAPGVPRRGSTARPGVYDRFRRLTARDVSAPPPLMYGAGDNGERAPYRLGCLTHGVPSSRAPVAASTGLAYRTVMSSWRAALGERNASISSCTGLLALVGASPDRRVVE